MKYTSKCPGSILELIYQKIALSSICLIQFCLRDIGQRVFKFKRSSESWPFLQKPPEVPAILQLNLGISSVSLVILIFFK